MLQAQGIRKFYGEHAAVAGIDLHAGRPEGGEVVGLLGPNGAGKTTTLRILSGLLLPTSGKVLVDGIDMTEEPERARSKVGFLPETPPLYPEMTVEAYLRFVAQIHGVRGRSTLDRALAEALEATDLESHRHARIDTLSHGFCRRVGIAHVLVHKPPVILLDEPTSGLDPLQVRHMRELIRTLRQRHTIIVSSHMLSEVQAFCDRIIVLQAGTVVAEGTQAELAARTRPRNDVSIEVRGDKAELEAALSAAAFVESFELDDSDAGARDGRVCRATVELSGDQREELASYLIAAGLGLRKLDLAGTGELERLFLELTATAAVEN